MSSFSLSPVNCNFKISLILSTHICSPHSPLEFFGPIIMDYTWTILLWRLFAPMQWYLPEAFSRQRQLEYLYMLHHKWSHDLSNKTTCNLIKAPGQLGMEMKLPYTTTRKILVLPGLIKKWYGTTPLCNMMDILSNFAWHESMSLDANKKIYLSVIISMLLGLALWLIG